jgi:hypothetical protein
LVYLHIGLQYLSDIYLILRNIERDIITIYF